MQRLDFLSKFFLVLLSVLVIIRIFFSGIIDPLLKHPFSCFGFDFVTFFLSIVPAYLFIILPILAITIGMASVSLAKANKIKLDKPIMGLNLWGVLVIVIIICFIMSMTLATMCACGASYKARDARRMSDLRQIAAAQDTYFQKYSWYADTQQDLVNEGMLSSVIADPSTGAQYTDADGNGINGGDSDPQTWGAKADLEGSKPFVKEVCDKSRPKPVTRSYYFCNEKGCNTVHR